MALHVRRNRRQTRGKYRLRAPQWVDPYPAVPGTVPEKMVFAILRQLNIYFIFHDGAPADATNYSLQVFDADVDFLLPEYRLVIDPFSPFHHSQDKSVPRDIQKVVNFAAAGYAYYHPWADGENLWHFDQYQDSSDSLVYRYRKGKRVVTRQTPLYEGVNATRNKYRKLDRSLHTAGMGTQAMIMSIPEITRGPLYKLTDPRDIKAKAGEGFRYGSKLTYDAATGRYRSPGDKAVAAANATRRIPHRLAIRQGTRQNNRGRSL